MGAICRWNWADCSCVAYFRRGRTTASTTAPAKECDQPSECCRPAVHCLSLRPPQYRAFRCSTVWLPERRWCNVCKPGAWQCYRHQRKTHGIKPQQKHATWPAFVPPGRDVASDPDLGGRHEKVLNVAAARKFDNGRSCCKGTYACNGGGGRHHNATCSGHSHVPRPPGFKAALSAAEGQETPFRGSAKREPSGLPLGTSKRRKKHEQRLAQTQQRLTQTRQEGPFFRAPARPILHLPSGARELGGKFLGGTNAKLEAEKSASRPINVWLMLDVLSGKRCQCCCFAAQYHLHAGFHRAK